MKPRIRGSVLHMTAAALLVLTTSLGHAAPSTGQPRDKVTAEALFQDGRRLLEESKYSVACAKLAESQRLDPAVGTLLYLALCYEQSNRTASAWQTYLSAESAAREAGQTERMHTAHERAAALEPKLITLTIQVPLATAGLEVTRDGVLLGQAAWDAAFPIDPGEHTVTASAPGKQSVTLRVTLKGAVAHEVVTLPLLKDAPVTTPSASSPNVGMPLPPTQPHTEPTNEPPVKGAASRTGATQRMVGIALGVAGVAGFGLGTFFVLRSSSKDDQSNQLCGLKIGAQDPSACNGEGLRLNEQALTAAKNAKVSFALGGAALLGGIIVNLAAPRETTSGRLVVLPLVGQSIGGIAISGLL
jgi:serine/threonine-protein kinase